MPPRTPPKKAKALYQEALNRDVHLAFRLPEEIADPFDAPEFYEEGHVATVTNGDIRYTIWRLGYPIYAHCELILSTAEEFRENFADGVSPGDADFSFWKSNGFFEVFRGDPGGEGDVFFSLHDSVIHACDQALRED